MAWQLNPALVDWAYRLTRAIELPCGATVLTGAALASNSLWHGALLNRWAEQWVDYWTEGRARFVASAMEDAGIVSSLHALARAGRVDRERLLILRTASNYNVPPEGVGAAASLAGEMRQGFTAYEPALEAAYRVGSAVVREIVEQWSSWEVATWQNPDRDGYCRGDAGGRGGARRERARRHRDRDQDRPDHAL